ncbi:uncharacterized protein A1O9_12067 [Exophiala aquamarina CBS 119918]|uniref:Major facilitator superfamily (MFS) profile domain-containing protein n=1 Tax=Exophiala aquamarina CBS 119918 TaxID=1182545 RepID=A0A072P808_9EURO|nr:uncharacterized protein A1O9_12067 [Exophiala aquamarina CBS 119918]KEF51730.1 hypothetical protein A1O9_12067 [Exophiala aquamarina CBS 119918]
MLLVSVGLVIPQVGKEFVSKSPSFAVMALYVGLLVGALSCGFLVDLIGRRLVWIMSLFLVSIFTMICAAAPNFAALCVFIVLQAIAGGGNIAIDLTVFCEFLPKKNRYLMTALASMWGVGNTLGGLLAWPLIANYSCSNDATPADCARLKNMGWRYQYITVGGFCLVMALARVFLFRMEESPRWLAAQGRLDSAYEALARVARLNKSSIILQHDRPPPPHVEISTLSRRSLSPQHRDKFAVLHHVKGLFENPKIARSSVGVFFLWMGIGIAYPVYTLFLPAYLSSKGAKLGDGSVYVTYRDYTISSTVGIFGPILSGFLVQLKFLGRRRSMTVTACCAAAFAIAFTTAKTEAQNIAFSSMINFWQNAYYGILYAYTPEVMPLSNRGTGCGMAVAFGRLASITSPLVAIYGNTSTSAPLWVCCGLYFAMAAVALFLPFEPEHYYAQEDQLDQEMLN